MTGTIRTADFIDSMGINIHTEYTDGGYVNTSAVLSALQYLGIHNLRDGAVWTANQGQASYGKIADAGYKFDMIIQGNRDPGDAVAAVGAFAAAHPGSVNAVEGPNEVNNWSLSYSGLTGTAAAMAFQNVLAQDVATNSSLAGSAVYSFTGEFPATGASSPGNYDFANFHDYAQNGAQPLGSLLSSLANLRTVTSKPAVLTEAGYVTQPTIGAWGGVDDATQAKLTLNLFLDASKAGVSRTYVYQLFDAYSDPTGGDPDKHLGLFDLSYHAKPAATAIHNLTTILADSSIDAANFVTSNLDYSISGMPSDGSTLDMQKASGVHDLLLWAEPTVWNAQTHQEITAPTNNATVDFGTNHVSVSVYDPLVSDQAIATYTDVTSVTVGVEDHPVIVEVTDIPDPAIISHASPAMTYTSADTYTFQDGEIAVAFSGTGAFTAFGNELDNTIVGGLNGGNALRGGGGNDTLTTSNGDNYLQGNAGDDVITVGVNASDEGGSSVSDSVGFNRVNGGSGNDAINIKGAGHAAVNGNLGNDTITDTGIGDNTLRGGQGNDTIFGGSGHSILMGDLGNDVIHVHGSSDEAATAGSSQHIDLITGGDGSDTFDFSALGAGQAALFAGTVYYQEITDFQPGVDKIVLPTDPTSADHVGTSSVVFGSVHEAAIYALSQLVPGGSAHSVELLSVGSSDNTFLFYSDPHGLPADQSETAGLDVIHLDRVSATSISYADL